MTMALTSGREYNRRAAIIERPSRWTIINRNNSVFWTRSTVYDVMAKYSTSEQSNESFSTPVKSHLKERTARTPAVVERTQALISL